MTIEERLAAAGLPALPRKVWLEIDEDALRNNVAVFRELIGPHVEFMGVVKADAYGHGLVPVARVLESAGVTTLCVISIDEALALRSAGIRTDILLLYPMPAARLADAIEHDIRISIAGSDTHATGVEAEAAIETGLSRVGILADQLP